MDDLISRQDAIKVIDRERKKKHLFNTAEDGLLEARGIINTLPSTPDTNQHVQHVLCVDLISRQDAIAEFRDGRDVYDIMESIESLPSAQPNGDLISRRDVIELVKKSYYDLSDGEEDMWAMVHDVEQLPSAPDSRQRGEWVLSHIGTIAEGFYCSRCGKLGYKTDFCPNCGADMRGDSE